MERLQAARLARESSRVGVLLSLAFLAAGLFFAYTGLTVYHMVSLGGGILVGFVASIAASYIASGAGRRIAEIPRPLLAALVAPPPLLAVSPLLGLLDLRLWMGYTAALLAPMAAPALWAAAGTKATVRLSLAGVAASSLMGSAYLASALALSLAEPVLPITLFIGLLLAYPIPMIYSVSVHSLPSTYRVTPIPHLYPILLALNAAAIALLWACNPKVGYLVASTALLAYFPTIGFHHLPTMVRRVWEARGVVKKTHAYFLQGHVYALLAAAYAFVLAVLAAFGTPIPLPCIIHALAVGFIGTHIFIHAPLMLPVILGIPTARRYSVAPYTLLAIAAASYCISRLLVWATLLAALALLVLVVWPPPRRRANR